MRHWLHKILYSLASPLNIETFENKIINLVAFRIETTSEFLTRMTNFG